MPQFFSRSLAYLRGRWHAGMEFKSNHRQAALLQRLDLLDLQLAAALQSGHERLERSIAVRSEADSRAHAARSAAQASCIHTSTAEVKAQAALLANRTNASLGAVIQELRQAIADCQRATVGTVDSTRAELSDALARQAISTSTLSDLGGHVSSLDARITSVDMSLESLRHRFSGMEGAIAGLEQTLSALHKSVSDAAVKNIDDKPGLPPTLDRRELEHKGLFLVGCARSGTTILSEVLNMSRDVHLLMEAFLYDLCRPGNAAGECDFADQFNARHVSYGNVKAKGAFAPRRGPAPQRCLDYLSALGQDYRYVGEKVAFGPDMGNDWEERFVAFQAEHFFHSHYVLIARRPTESIWSMSKMFHESSIESLVDAWLGSLRVNMEIYTAFPHARFVFFEHLETGAVAQLATWLDTRIDMPPHLLNCRQQKSSLRETELPEVLRPYAYQIGQCEELYRDLRHAFCPRQLTYVGASLASSFMLTQRRRLDILRNTLHAAPRIVHAA